MNENQIYSEMHPVYGNKCFTMRTVHFWCKKVLGGQTFASYNEVRSVVRQWQGRRRVHGSGPPNSGHRKYRVAQNETQVYAKPGAHRQTQTQTQVTNKTAYLLA